MPKTRKLKGRSVSARDLKLIHQSAYKKVRDKQVGDWILDEPISKTTASVYFNPKINQAIVVHRGTEGTLSDWSNQQNGIKMQKQFKKPPKQNMPM